MKLNQQQSIIIAAAICERNNELQHEMVNFSRHVNRFHASCITTFAIIVHFPRPFRQFERKTFRIWRFARAAQQAAALSARYLFSLCCDVWRVFLQSSRWRTFVECGFGLWLYLDSSKMSEQLDGNNILAQALKDQVIFAIK